MVSDAWAWLRARVVVAAAAAAADDDDGRWQAQHVLGGLKGGQCGIEAVRWMLARLLACRRCRHPAIQAPARACKNPAKKQGRVVVVAVCQVRSEARNSKITKIGRMHRCHVIFFMSINNAACV